jgi:hypothetical protein
VRIAVRPFSLALLTLEGHDVNVGDWVLASAGLAVDDGRDSGSGTLIHDGRRRVDRRMEP